MRLDLTQVSARRGCSKPGCKATLVYRHHRGGERTFVRHFEWMRGLKGYKRRYREFVQRYEAFDLADITAVCGDHHEEVHDLIEAFDLDWMVENNCIKAFGAFTWDEAERLIAARRRLTDAWLKECTPGLRTRKYTGRP